MEKDEKMCCEKQEVHEDLLKITVMDQIHNMIQAMCDRKVLLEKMKEGSYDKGELVSLRVRFRARLHCPLFQSHSHGYR